MNCPLDGATLKDTGFNLFHCYQCGKYWKWVVLDGNGNPILDPAFFRDAVTYKVQKELREVIVPVQKPLHGSGMRHKKPSR